MKFKNKKAEKHFKYLVSKNKKPYGVQIIQYAALWAEIMEDLICENKPIQDQIFKFAEKSACDADKTGITGAAFSAAYLVLKETWIYGEELKDWYEKKYKNIDNIVL